MKFQPSEIENFPFYEYEMHVEKLNEVLKKQQEGQADEESQYGSMNPEKYMKDVQRQYAKPNMSPKMPNFKM